MIRSILMGAVAGSRSMTPMAVVTHAARAGKLPGDDLLVQFLATNFARTGAYVMAAGELAGDKMESAPNRIVFLGMVARVVSSAVAGAALAAPNKRVPAVLAAVAVSTVSAHLTWRARMAAINNWTQTRTGLVEDAIIVASALAVANVGRDRRGGTQPG